MVGQEEGTIWEACPLKPDLVMGSGESEPQEAAVNLC